MSAKTVSNGGTKGGGTKGGGTKGGGTKGGGTKGGLSEGQGGVSTHSHRGGSSKK